MKIILFFALATLNISFASAPKREKLFECAHLDMNSPVERVFISKYTLGSRSYYELEIKLIIGGLEESYSKRVNLVSKYDGKILHFTNGNHRIKIDRVQERNGQYSAFGRIPEYDVHSFDWTCKDIN